MKVDNLKSSIKSCTSNALKWFYENATTKSQAEWSARNALQDNGKGAVYAFLNRRNACLYIGQTTQKLKSRANVNSSNHYQSDWEKWTTLKFVNVPNKTDQIVLEMLLILELSPQYNVKPAARNIDDILSR